MVMELGSLGKKTHRVRYCTSAVLDAYFNPMVQNVGAEDGCGFVCHEPRNKASVGKQNFFVASSRCFNRLKSLYVEG